MMKSMTTTQWDTTLPRKAVTEATKEIAGKGKGMRQHSASQHAGGTGYCYSAILVDEYSGGGGRNGLCTEEPDL